MAFHPYLFFGGNCREAFTRYQEVFGGELFLLTNQDMPENERMPGVDDSMIMHAALTIDGNLLMGSDDPTAESPSAVHGMQVNYSISEVAEAERVFNELSDGGQVNMAIEQTSWSPAFGMCTDKFGTPWMISADPPS